MCCLEDASGRTADHVACIYIGPLAHFPSQVRGLVQALPQHCSVGHPLTAANLLKPTAAPAAMPPAAQATGPQPGQQGRKRSSSSSGSEGRPAAKRPVLVTLERSGRQSPSPLPSPSATGAASASGFRGVTYHQRTGRFESHIWCGKKQVYLVRGGGQGWAIRGHAHLPTCPAKPWLTFHPALLAGRLGQRLSGSPRV